MTAAPASAVTFQVRLYRATDESFVYSSFLRSQRDEDAFAGVGNDIFFSTLKREMADMLATFNVFVAHPEGDEDEIAGYLLAHADVIGYLYVKREPWRQQGVARLLFDHASLTRRPSLRVMFPTSKGMRLARLKGIDVRPCRHVEALALTARAA
jgi:hypothetical protein